MSLPVVRGTSEALYPFTQVISFDTYICAWQSAAEQRYVRRGGLMRFELTYNLLTQAQKDSVKSAISSAKGQYDTTTLTLTLGSTTYTNLNLDSDVWEATERETTRYTSSLKLSQTITQSLSPGTAGTAFPTLANGTMSLLPYTQRKRYQTIATKSPAGMKYTRSEFGGGFTGYPTDGLLSWTLDEQHLTDADLATRINHFIANYGRAFSFSFTDEDSTTYTKTHYAMDEMSIRYNGVNDSAVTIQLEAVN
jgi:hypothetical protein